MSALSDLPSNVIKLGLVLTCSEARAVCNWLVFLGFWVLVAANALWYFRSKPAPLAAKTETKRTSSPYGTFFAEEEFKGEEFQLYGPVAVELYHWRSNEEADLGQLRQLRGSLHLFPKCLVFVVNELNQVSVINDPSQRPTQSIWIKSFREVAERVLQQNRKEACEQSLRLVVMPPNFSAFHDLKVLELARLPLQCKED